MIINCKHWNQSDEFFRGKCDIGKNAGRPSYGECIDLCEECFNKRCELDIYIKQIQPVKVIAAKHLPPIYTMARNFSNFVKDAAYKAITDGRVFCCDEQKKRRWAECEDCPHLEKVKKHWRCVSFEGKAGCGCYLEQKIKYAAAVCKQNYWKHIDKDYEICHHSTKV